MKILECGDSGPNAEQDLSECSLRLCPLRASSGIGSGAERHLQVCSSKDDKVDKFPEKQRMKILRPRESELIFK